MVVPGNLIRINRIGEVIILCILFGAIALVYKNQKQITFNGGKGMDGLYYYAIADQFKNDNAQVRGDLPFIKRVGTTFLIGKYSKITGNDILKSGLVVNLAGTLITVLLLALWLRAFIQVYWIRLLLCSLFLLSWLVPLRMSFYYPMTSDAWGMALFMAGLLLLNKIYLNKTGNTKGQTFNLIALGLVTSIGVVFRESNLALALAAPFVGNPFKQLSKPVRIFNLYYIANSIRNLSSFFLNRKTLLLFLPLVCGLATNVLLTKSITINPNQSYSYIRTAVAWLYVKSLPQYLLGILIAYGPLIVLLPFYFKQYIGKVKEREDLIMILLMSMIFGFIGGNDTERIFFTSSFPVVFWMLGISITALTKERARGWLAILLLLQTIAYRLYWFLPDYPSAIEKKPVPFFTFWGTDFPLLYLFSHHGNLNLNMILLAEYFLLLIITGFVINTKVKPRVKSIVQ